MVGRHRSRSRGRALAWNLVAGINDPPAGSERDENRLLVRSRYRQPFGTFAGELVPGLTLARGLGVMEDHDVHW